MQKKLFIIFSIILLLANLLAGFLSMHLIRSSYLDELEVRLVSNGRLLEQQLERDKTLHTNNIELRKIVKDYDKVTDSRITIIDFQGNVLADSFVDDREIENHLNRPEVEAAIRGEIGRSVRKSKTVDIEMLYVALPMKHIEGQPIIIRLAVDLIEIQKINNTLYRYIGISIAFGILISLLVGYRVINKIIKPIKEMTKATEKISEGHLNRKVYVSSKDEIGELADNFNIMASKLKYTIDQLSNSNTKFKALLTSMVNPIIAIDNKRNIIVINPAAENLFKVEAQDVIGKHILEIIRNNQLDETFKNIFLCNSEKKVEIQIKDPGFKILKVHTSLIKLEDDPTKTIGLVAIIEDVTEIRKLEKMRSDFVANVSHELRTPLTSISGFVETLKSGAIDDEATKMRFLDIIEIEADRLRRLIDDILTLSDIENTKKVFKQNINPSDLIKEVEQIITPIAISKNIEISSKIDLDLPSIAGSADWFKQMLINLMDNAVKYTPEGGKVNLAAYTKYNKLVISIRDTGIGIPKQDIPRLFERFYRIDKARTRKVGGTGLGLAIVKHIALSFNATIKVNSDIGKGTEFVVVIPLK